MSAADKPFTLVIDAGHGGHDTGARGVSSQEKDLTLKYSLAFGRMVQQNCPDVRIVYTRKTDVFIPLHERAEIANKNHADLFISFHINALENNHSYQGFQSYTLGRGERSGDKGIRENLEVAKRENSVIFMEKDYKKNYKGLDNSAETDILFELVADKNRERSVELSLLMQREVCKATGRINGGTHQNNLAVLRLTSMPAILLELGFISTPAEEDFLNSDAALPLYTTGIYNAFVTYKNKYDDRITVPYREASVESATSALVGTPAPSASRKTVAERKASTSGTEKDAPKASPSSAKQKTADKRQANRQNAKKEKVEQPVFKIQIIAGRNKLAANDRQFKGLTGCETIDVGGRYIYTYGASTDYNEINRQRKQILDKFPGCYVIAFKNGKQMDVNEAISEFKKNR